MGQTSPRQKTTALLEIVVRDGETVSVPEGYASADGKIFGAYLHGIFDNDNFRRAWLENLGVQGDTGPFTELKNAAFDHLADAVESALDIARLDEIIERGV